MKVRYQIYEADSCTLDAELYHHDVYEALRELCEVQKVKYHPDRIKRRANWLEIHEGGNIYRVMKSYWYRS